MRLLATRSPGKGDKEKEAEGGEGSPAAIPGNYIPQGKPEGDPLPRDLKTYTPEEALALKYETTDRYGKLPPVLEFLMDLTYVRSAAPDLQITKILCGRHETVIQGDPDGGWTDLDLRQPWIRWINGFVGPGGYAGICTLAELIRGKIG